MWYHINNIESLDTPALVVYPERIKANIQTAIAIAGDFQRLRPHVKTHKMAAVTKLMLAAGITKFKCATIAEAEMLAECGARDVLLAYQPVGPKLQRFIQLRQQFLQTQFSCLIDNAAAAAAIAKGDNTIPVFIDLNIGQNRTGIEPGEKASQLIKTCGLQVLGLHAYEGHIKDADINKRTELCHKAFALVRAMQQPGMTIIAGGSPSFPVFAQQPDLECSPGTFVFWDQGYTEQCPEQPFQVAAMVVTRVISLPAPHLVCLDLGHKSVAAENPLAIRVTFQDAPHLKAVGQSEEHLVLDAGEGHTFKPGDVLYGVPFHICPTVALYDRAYTIEHKEVSGEWPIVARTRKITI